MEIFKDVVTVRNKDGVPLYNIYKENKDPIIESKLTDKEKTIRWRNEQIHKFLLSDKT